MTSDHPYWRDNFMGSEHAASVSLNDLRELVRRLRAPDGCPWDRVQTLQNIGQYLLEECYEALEAMEEPDPEALREELGDLLFQIVFVASIAEEQDRFTLEDVLRGIHDKMVRRHPHVFGSRAEPVDVESVRENWLRIKQKDRGNGRSVLEGIPVALPALQRAYRMGKRAGQVGFDWPDSSSVFRKVQEEMDELGRAVERAEPRAVREELGDLLFALAQLARHLGENPEQALQASNRKFLARFRALEQKARREGRPMGTLSQEEWDQWWEEIKREAP
jgi:tetrapyrrole methylase family protein/MazG family protein